MLLGPDDPENLHNLESHYQLPEHAVDLSFLAMPSYEGALLVASTHLGCFWKNIGQLASRPYA